MFFGGLALLLAGLGLYGVTSYAVNSRRTEIGIRMALGANPGGVVRLVLRRVALAGPLGVAWALGLSAWAAGTSQRCSTASSRAIRRHSPPPLACWPWSERSRVGCLPAALADGPDHRAAPAAGAAEASKAPTRSGGPALHDPDELRLQIRGSLPDSPAQIAPSHQARQAGKLLTPKPQASPHLFVAQTVVSHYRVLHKLGEGGMGVVYRAEDLRLDREVAIKFLRKDDHTHAPWLTRFEREARLASALKHPHICTIHEIGEDDGRPFIVMELLEGRTLKQRIEEGALPVEQVVHFGVQIAMALEAAHARGIIHRDIKPANLFVTHEDHVKVLDFGLAKLTDRQAAGHDRGDAGRGADARRTWRSR